jgi:rhomboid family GlyGly-CTERM serine protease
LIAFFNVPLLLGSFQHTLIFVPGAAWDCEWWRLFTHPFVHATWYHLLLDGAAFLLFYGGLMEPSIWRRLAFVAAASLGSVAVACAASDVALNGLCGLSGVAHGLMAVSALEMITTPRASTRRLGWLCYVLVVGKAAIEAVQGKMFFTWLHFGLMGEPVAASHAGGILGSLTLALLFKGCGHKEWGTKTGAARRVRIPVADHSAQLA